MTQEVRSPATNVTETLLRDLMAQRILILDGAMGTMIQQYKLEEADYRGERFAGFQAPAGERELFVKGNNELLTLTQPAPTSSRPTPSVPPRWRRTTITWRISCTR